MPSNNVTVYSFEEWTEIQLQTRKKCSCYVCDGEGEIEEELQSSSGRYHTICETCEECGGDGELKVEDVPDGVEPFKFKEYKLDTINTLRMLAQWSRQDFFELLCSAKPIFQRGRTQ